MRTARVQWWGLTAALVALMGVAGCSASLPGVRSDYIECRAQAIPPDAAPVFSWTSAEETLHTYWGIQRIEVRVRGWMPSSAAGEADARWEVAAQTREGTPVPFIGTERRYMDGNGRPLAKLVPLLDLGRVPDGLYIVISPGLEFADGKLVKAMPVANVIEIRQQSFKPFWFPIPLIPDTPSDLTPAPPPPPEEPEGTPLPS